MADLKQNQYAFNTRACAYPECGKEMTKSKGPVKLMQRVKIAHSFLQSVSNLFHFIILSLPI